MLCFLAEELDATEHPQHKECPTPAPAHEPRAALGVRCSPPLSALSTRRPPFSVFVPCGGSRAVSRGGPQETTVAVNEQDGRQLMLVHR